MRRMFQLPAEDEATLDALGFSWETLIEGPRRWLLIHNYAITEGFNVKSTDLALSIDSLYPDTQIDMVYFYPALAKLDGGGINALSDLPFDGKIFQQWSRHRTGENPWRPGVDDIGTHLLLVDHWLEREVGVKTP